MFNTDVFKNIKTPQDFVREEQEFQARKRQQAMQEQLANFELQRAQRELNTPESLSAEQLLAKSIQLGGVQALTPQEQAQLQAYDIAQRTKQSVDARGNVITNRSIFDMLPNQVNQMQPSQVMQMPTRSPVPVAQAQEAPLEFADLNEDQFRQVIGNIYQKTQGNAPQPKIQTPSTAGLSPYAQDDINKSVAQSQINLQEQAAKLQQQETLKKQAAVNKNKQLFDVFDFGIKNLEKQMSGAVTNPITGKIPAITPAQQKAEGSIAPMEQVLKDIFRQAGEGTFTDKDQERLINMLPTRTDFGSVRDQKLRDLRELVALKLGVPLQNKQRLRYNAETGRLE